MSYANSKTISGDGFRPTSISFESTTSASVGLGDINISDMKRKLDMLLKQTDYIEKGKNPTPPDATSTEDYAGARSLSANSRFSLRDQTDRS